MIVLDTNIILRYLLADNEELSVKAKKYFIQAEAGKYKLYLDEVILAETIWVLGSYYEQDKKKIVPVVRKLVNQDWIVMGKKTLCNQALETWLREDVSYIDSWVYSLSREKGVELETFDAKLVRLNGREG